MSKDQPTLPDMDFSMQENESAESIINDLRVYQVNKTNDLVKSDVKSLTLREALETYELVSANYDPANGSYIVLSDRDPKLSPDTAFKEMGYSSPSPYTSWTRDERVPELRDKSGIRTYYDMKRADGQVRSSLRLFKTPVMAARWFMEPASDSPLDQSISKFVEENLFERLSTPWHRVLEDALLMCDYGYMPLEKVFDIDDDGKIYLKKLAPRHPLDIQEWVYDSNGGPDGLVMDATEANGFNGIFIPISKMVVFVLEQEGGDMRGISILRSAYKHYYYKDTLYKIDAIQKERHGIGVPVIKIPAGASAADKSLAEELGRNMRTNERAHITLPPNWEFMFAKLEGQPVDCMPSIAHHNEQIMSNILAFFSKDPNAKEDAMNMFYKGTRYVALTIAETMNRYVIKQLVDFNYKRGKYPKLRARRIGENEDLRTWSFAYRNLVGAGSIIPDDELERFIRLEMDLPPMDKSTSRTVATPQNPNEPEPEDEPEDEKLGNLTDPRKSVKPPKVGPPRQKTSPPIGVGQKNTGRDGSGG